GSGRMLMRAASLVRGVVAAVGLGADAPAVFPLGRGKGVLVTGGGGGGGSTVRGAGTPPTGGVGNGFCDTGGLGIGTLPGFGDKVTAVGDGGCEGGGGEGSLI